ncbi:MAG: hypothetical protein ACRD6W_19495 [Nitrososphaerales archaeon]
MVAWVTLEVALLYAIVVASFALSLLAVAFAYRLSRITGLFGAWSLLIAGLGLTAFEDFAYFGSVIFVSYGKVETIVEGYTWGTFIFAGLILLAIPILFFGSMYKLHSIFRARAGKPEGRGAPQGQILG